MFQDNEKLLKKIKEYDVQISTLTTQLQTERARRIELESRLQKYSYTYQNRINHLEQEFAEINKDIESLTAQYQKKTTFGDRVIRGLGFDYRKQAETNKKILDYLEYLKSRLNNLEARSLDSVNGDDDIIRRFNALNQNNNDTSSTNDLQGKFYKL